jgi:hypothetical protein
MSVLPEGEQMRNAVRWISAERTEHPTTSLGKLIEQACLKFDLSPKDAEVLFHFFADKPE